jgi:hypothetical protein
VFDTDLNRFYLFNGTIWEDISVGNLWNRSGTNTLLSHSGDYVGIGTTTPARPLEVRGPWQTARISTSASGSMLEFVSDVQDDWAISTWSGYLYLLKSTDDFATKTDEYIITDSYFSSYGDNDKTLGTATSYWNDIYSIDGTFSGYIGIGTTNPDYDVDIHKSSASAFYRAKSNTSFAGLIIDKASATDNGYIVYKTNNVANWYAGTIKDENYSISADFTNPDGKFYIQSNGYIGIGTTTPAKQLEISSSSAQPLRLSSSGSGSQIELLSSNSTDWKIGTWGETFRIISSDDEFSTTQDQYLFSTTVFRPWADNTKELGTSSMRWSTIYGQDGDFAGDIGIGTSNPNYELDIYRPSTSAWIRVQSGSGYAGLIIDKGNTSSNGYIMYHTSGSGKWYVGMIDNDNYAISTDYTLSEARIYIEQSTGDVAIGGTTTASGYKLSVDGDIICEELRVELIADWPDYVFRKDYDLLSIPELSCFIDQHGHLPDIPPAEEIENGGFEVGEMQKLMMKKIEELSLYVIKQQEEIESLKLELNKIKK